MCQRKTKVSSLKMTVAEEEAVKILKIAGKVKSKSDALRQGLYLLIDKYVVDPRVLGKIHSERSIQPARQGPAVRPSMEGIGIMKTPDAPSPLPTPKPLMETLEQEYQGHETVW